MKGLRHLGGFAVACLLALILPMVLHVGWQLHQCEPDTMSQPGGIEFPRDFWPDLGMALIFCSLLAVLLGGGSIVLLRIAKCVRLRAYALAGMVLGLILGAELSVLTWQWDGSMFFALRVGMPTASMVLLTCNYWVMCIRGKAVTRS